MVPAQQKENQNCVEEITKLESRARKTEAEKTLHSKRHQLLWDLLNLWWIINISTSV